MSSSITINSKALNQRDVKIINEVFWVRPRLIAPRYIDPSIAYPIKRQKVKKNFQDKWIIYLEEYDRWLLLEYFYIDPIIYN